MNAASEPTFLICDLRAEWKHRPYVSFWRPNNANYAYPLAWSGDYPKSVVDEHAGYYTEFDRKELVRFAVPRSVALALSEAPKPGTVDGDTGPVVPQNITSIRILREAAYIPENFKRWEQETSH